MQAVLDGSVSTLAPDLLGYGAAPRPGGAYTLERIVEYLVPIVEREQPTHVVGHSMGGIIALALALALPNQFERVGIISVPVFATRKEGLDYLHRRGLFHRAVLHADYLSHAGCSALQRMRPFWLPFAPLFVPHQPRAVIRGAFDHCRDSHQGSLDNVIFAGHVARLASSVSSPVVALHGGHDRAAPHQNARAIAADAGWQFRLSPTANHQIVVERPALVARWLRGSVLGGDDPRS
jgi:pimeloyl-ACP methyl ester carboxylesterase